MICLGVMSIDFMSFFSLRIRSMSSHAQLLCKEMIPLAMMSSLVTTYYREVGHYLVTTKAPRLILHQSSKDSGSTASNRCCEKNIWPEKDRVC